MISETNNEETISKYENERKKEITIEGEEIINEE